MNTNEMDKFISTVETMDDYETVYEALAKQKIVIRENELLKIKKAVFIGCYVSWFDKIGNQLSGKVIRINEDFVRVEVDDDNSAAVNFSKIINISETKIED
jgi:hypothetical protein